MSFIYAESLIEFAMRIGVADLAADPDALGRLLRIDQMRNVGLDLTPPNGDVIHDPTLYDEFQQKIDELVRLKGEEGVRPVFRNAIPDLPDLVEYLRTANVSIRHGYPREAQDLPCVSITLADESEGQQYNGQLKSTQKGVDAQGRMVVENGSDMDASYHIHVLTTNYDETVFLFHLIKYALLKYRDHLEGYGICQQQMSWQACEPAPDYLQGGVFAYQRTCVFSCTKNESFEYARPGYNQLAYTVSDAATPDVVILDEAILPCPLEGAP